MLPVLGKKAVLEWRMQEGLIGSSYGCPKCGKSMELRERVVEEQLEIDRMSWVRMDCEARVSRYWPKSCRGGGMHRGMRPSRS
ncbi:hypothetical protein TNCV_4741151 [Trichonephila clavipes]|nr:hypothetical protein TNCV_4741151 [Trichonephila clavipes]